MPDCWKSTRPTDPCDRSPIVRADSLPSVSLPAKDDRTCLVFCDDSLWYSAILLCLADTPFNKTTTLYLSSDNTPCGTILLWYCAFDHLVPPPFLRLAAGTGTGTATSIMVTQHRTVHTNNSLTAAIFQCISIMYVSCRLHVAACSCMFVMLDWHVPLSSYTALAASVLAVLAGLQQDDISTIRHSLSENHMFSWRSQGILHKNS